MTSSAFPVCIALTLAVAAQAPAASFYWDGTDSTSSANGGPGTWDTTATNWDTANSGGANIAWGNTTADIAVFGAASGIITIGSAGVPGGTLTLGGLSFPSGNYVVGNVAGNGTLSFGSVTGTLNTVNATNGTTLNCNFASTGTPGITIAANGNLTASGGGNGARVNLNGDNTGLANGMTITSGLVAFANQNAAGNATVTLNGGGILQAIAGGQTLANAFVLTGTGTLRQLAAATQTLTGVVSGSGTLSKTDAGVLVLSGANTFTGQTQVNGGTLSVATLNSVNGGTPLLASSGLGAPTTIAAGTITLGSGTSAGGLIYTGSGETTDRVLDFAGTTAAATLTQSGTGLLKFTSAPTVSGAGSKTLTLAGSTAGTGEIAGGIVDNSATNLTSVTKSGTGTWTLSGTNTYTGVTTISGGTLAFSRQTTGWTTANLVVNSGGTLGLSVGGPGEFTLADVATLDALGSATGGLKTGAFLGLDTTNQPGGILTYSGILANAGTSTATGLAKLGAGTLVLTGANTYTGGTRIDGGTLSVANTGFLPATGTVTVNSAGTLAVSGANASHANTISGAGRITVTTSTGSIATALSGNLGGFTGTIEVAPATSGGKLTLTQTVTASQSNTPPAAATIKVLKNADGSGGTLYLNNAFTYASAIQLYGGTTGETLGQLRLENCTVSGAVTLKATTSLGTNSGTGTISGVISDEGNGFGFTKLGVGTTTLTGANTFSGAIAIPAGFLKANSFNNVAGGTASSGLGAPATVASGTISLGDLTVAGGLSYGGTGQTTDRVINLAGTTGAGILDHAGTGLLKFTSDLSVTGAGSKALTLQGSGTGEFAGAIVNGSSPTGLVKTGGGTWTLSGTNTYTGTTFVNGGILLYANANAIPNNGRSISISGNGTVSFDYNTSLQTLLTTRVVAASSGTIALTANNNLAENLDFGAAGFTGYLGAKDNLTYTGTLAPNGGTVRVGGGTGTITLNGSSIITGSNNLATNGAVVLTSPQSYTGTTFINGGMFNGGGTVLDVSKTTLSGGGITNATIIGSGTLVKTGGNTVTIACANTWTGGTTLSEGVIVASDNAAFGTGAVGVATTGTVVARIQLTNGVTISNPLSLGVNLGVSGRGVLEINNTSSNATWAGPISLTANPTNGGHFYTDATSTLTLSGPITSTVPVSFRAGNFIIPSASTSSYSSIFISGALKIGSSNALVSTSDVTLGNSATTTLDLNGFNQTVNTVVKGPNAAAITNTATIAAALIINNASASTYAGTIVDGTGPVALVKSGSGTLTLGGANTYSGSTTVNAGTLVLGASTLANSSTVSIASGAKLSMTTASDIVAHLFLDGVEVLPGTYGATGSGAAHIDDTHFSGTGSLSVVTGPSGYNTWAALKGLTSTNVADSANPDNDGLNNLGEFALDGSPTNPASDGRIVTKVAVVNGIKVLTITLPVRNGAIFSGTTEQVSAGVDGVIYRIQGGTDLTSWTGVVAEVPLADRATVQAGIALPESGWTNRSFYLSGTAQLTGFLRAKVQEAQ